MSNKPNFDRIVAGQDVFADHAVPAEWMDFRLGRAYPHINPVSAIAQIAIEHETSHNIYRNGWRELDIPRPIQTQKYQGDESSGLALLVRREHNEALEVISGLQHMFRVQYRGIIAGLLETPAPDPIERFDTALALTSQNTMQTIDRVYYHESSRAQILIDAMPELEFFYAHEHGLHFQAFVDKREQ